MAHPQLQAVRQHYNFHCGFCGISETDAGGELTVDHFEPISSGGSDDLDNLVYACIRCNQYKGARQFDPADPQQRLLHPMRDDIIIHMREDEITGLLIGLTITRQFHITTLQLNRPQLVAHRQRRRAEALQQIETQEMRLEMAALRERDDRREQLVQRLRARLRESSGQSEAEQDE